MNISITAGPSLRIAHTCRDLYKCKRQSVDFTLDKKIMSLLWSRWMVALDGLIVVWTVSLVGLLPWTTVSLVGCVHGALST